MKHCSDNGYDQEMMYNEMYGMEMMPCHHCSHMQNMPMCPMYSMHQNPMMQPMEQMPCMPMADYYSKHSMMPLMEETCSEEYPVAGIVDYYKDEDSTCEEAENFLQVMNEEYPDLSDEAKSALKQLMEIDFSILELSLYLDTHPEDRRALAQHNYYVEQRKPLVKKLERLYSPLTIFTKAGYPWAWLNQPWPWRIEF